MKLNLRLDTLIELYREPWRYYHTLEHIRELHEYYKQHFDKLTDPQAVLFAIWFHEYSLLLLRTEI